MSPTKAGLALDHAVLTGWVGGHPLVSVYMASLAPEWFERVNTSAGWQALGTLPDGSMPVTDGRSVATVLAPDAGNALALVDETGKTETVQLPAANWLATWLGVRGLTALGPGVGFLLVGASAIVRVDDHGTLTSADLPKGYVALGPTSDPKRFLLASQADAEEPGGLSASTPFGVFLWSTDTAEAPVLVGRQFTGVSPSSVGLAWLKSDDGSWSSLTAGGHMEHRVPPQKADSVISPDGISLVRLSYSATGCLQQSTDPCPIALVDASGSTHQFDGPASGAGFTDQQVGILLVGRPSLSLPWRLVVGDPTEPQTVPVN